MKTMQYIRSFMKVTHHKDLIFFRPQLAQEPNFKKNSPIDYILNFVLKMNTQGANSTQRNINDQYGCKKQNLDLHLTQSSIQLI